jgi:hypothetical protein|tara:strand:+ start:1106 stop:1255 length:150 start_codon:yes stop_codon:yes gene_type:complete
MEGDEYYPDIWFNLRAKPKHRHEDFQSTALPALLEKVRYWPIAEVAGTN